MDEFDFDPNKIVLCWISEPETSNKTAQEMFEALGFRKNESTCYNNHHIIYEKPVLNDIVTVEFKVCHVVYTDSCRHCLKMNSDILKAINQQMKELGWLEDVD